MSVATESPKTNIFLPYESVTVQSTLSAPSKSKRVSYTSSYNSSYTIRHNLLGFPLSIRSLSGASSMFLRVQLGLLSMNRSPTVLTLMCIGCTIAGHVSKTIYNSWPCRYLASVWRWDRGYVAEYWQLRLSSTRHDSNSQALCSIFIPFQPALSSMFARSPAVLEPS